MKKRSTIIFIAIIATLSGIGVIQGQRGETKSEATERQVFFIQTDPLTQKEYQGTITKTASVKSSSDITINAQVGGRVNNISVALGQKVGNKQRLLSMSDIAGSYSFGAQKAALSVQSAQNNFEINRLNLDKQIQDAQLAYQKTLVSSQSSIIGVGNSSADLQLQKLEQDLAKARSDYNAKLKSDDQTLENYVNTAKNVYSDVTNLMLDVIDKSDKFLGYTNENAHYNNGFEVYISVKDDNARYMAEQELAELINLREELKKLGDEITLDNITEFLSDYKMIVAGINEMTVAMKKVLNNTTPGGTLTPAGLDAEVAAFTTSQTRASSISSSITSQVNGIDLFVTTYGDNQNSLEQQIASLETQIAVSRRQLEDASQNAEISLEQSRNNLDFLKNTRDENLASLRNSLGQSQVAYQEAQFNLGKFSVNAPIEGVITEVMVDAGQEVSPGTPLIKMVSQGKEVEVKVTADERQYITIGQEVQLSYENTIVTGQVSEMSSVADSTANYTVKISIDEKTPVDIGAFVDVTIPLQGGNNIIPLNAVTIVDNNRGQIFIWNGENIETRTVTLGSVYGSSIEVEEKFSAGEELIVSDVSRYDPDSMDIKKRQ